MRGAISNQIVKCIIYTNDIARGIEQLDNIEKMYGENKVFPIRKIRSKYRNETIFDNEEEWIVIRPSDNERGYRWRKAYIDEKTVTIWQLHTIIKPCGNLYKWEDYKLF